MVVGTCVGRLNLIMETSLLLGKTKYVHTHPAVQRGRANGLAGGGIFLLLSATGRYKEASAFFLPSSERAASM